MNNLIKNLKKEHLILAAILIITIIAFSPTFENGFTNWDDGKQVTENLDIRELSFENVKKIFSSYYVGMYQPITTLCYTIEHSIFGMNPTGFHTTSLLFHLLNILLVFWMISLITKRKDMALIVASLFAVHPMFVEAIAWVSARSTLIYSSFYLGAIISYLYYLQNKERKYFILSLFLFLFSLLSKAMAMTLPVLLLLFDFYYNRKLFSKKVIIEKIPFFVLSIIFGIVAIQLRQIEGHLGGEFSIFDKLFIVSYQIPWYLLKLVLPINLSSYYPDPEKTNGFLPTIYYFFPIIILFITIIVIKLKKHWKTSIFTILFFLINIGLVLKIVQVGQQQTTDRYTYIPYVGLFLLLAYIYKIAIEKKPKLKRFLHIFILGIIIVLSVLSFNRTKIWKDSLVLWNDVIEKYNGVALAYNNRGNAKQALNDLQGAMEDYNKSVILNPKSHFAFNNRGLLKDELTDFMGAIIDFNKAIEISPLYYNAYISRGVAKMKINDFKGAINDCNKAISMNENSYSLFFSRGSVYEEAGNIKDALRDYNYSIKLNSDNNSDAYFYRGSLKGQRMGDLQGALIDFNKAIQIDPNDKVYYLNRGIVYSLLNNYSKTLEDYNKAIEIDSNYCMAYNNRAGLFLNANQKEKAKQDIAKAQSLGCQVNPNLLKLTK